MNSLKIDLESEIQYWREQCDILRKDVRVLRRELYWKEFCGKDKYEEFKDWVVENHSDVWIVKGIFDAFEKKYGEDNKKEEWKKELMRK